MSRSKNWTFTINNWTETDEEAVALLSEKARYLIVGRETGEEGTPHLQGYVVFKNQRTMSAVSKDLPRAHLEVAKGNSLQNRDYCAKDGDFHEVGERPLTSKEKGTSEKDRWERTRTLAREGRFDEIDADIWLRYDRNLLREHARARPLPPTLDALENEWHFGPTGTGKSRSVRTAYPDAYICNPSSLFWDGYHDQDVVIIEDLDKYHVKLGYFLKIWGDHYRFNVESKGKGERLIRPKKIIITSNYHPEDIWDDPETVNPILRRYTLVPYGPAPEPYAAIFNK